MNLSAPSPIINEQSQINQSQTMIIRQLTLRQMLGTQTTETLPAAPLAVYSEAEIETLLAGDDPQPEGIRFHFDRPAGSVTVGLIAVSLVLVPVGNTAVSTFEFTSDTKKYVQRGATNASLSKEQFKEAFQALDTKGQAGNTSVCVFFSRLDLRQLLDQPGITRIAFFPSSIQRNFTGAILNFDTLLAIGQTSAGVTQGLQIRSELPCPPHCGDDYPPA
jgi:hypothetical protein